MKKIYATILSLALAVPSFAQWSETPQELIPAGTNVYANESMTGPGGTTWYVFDYPNCVDEYDIPNVTYEFRLQAFDKEGKKLFGDMGMLVSAERNRSWTVCNQILYVDRDDNAIVAVSDARNSDSDALAMSYTVYKVSPSGEMLWGDEGVAVDGGYAYDIVAHMSMTQIADGSYVMAWMRSSGETALAIEMQRLSSDGELLWNADETRLIATNSTFQYPYVIDAGDNQVIVVYAKGASQDIYARKLDFDGSPVWASDTRIYRGGWGTIPLWTILSVQPSGDGGVLVGWNDDRAFTNFDSAFMSYVKPDGSLGFTGASEEGDVKLGYDGMRALNVSVIAHGDKFYALWREVAGSQSYQGLKAQCVSRNGELLWDEEGVTILPMEQQTIGYLTMSDGPEGEVTPFYMLNTGVDNVVAYITPLDETTGAKTLTDENYVISEGYYLAQLTTQPVKALDGWVTTWTSGVSSKDHYIQKVNFDYTLTAIDNVTGDNSALRFFHDGTGFVVEGAEGETAIDIYDMAGRKIEQPSAGTYIARLRAANGVRTIKLNLK